MASSDPVVRALRGKIKGAKSRSEVGLAQNAGGVAFKCGTCEYFTDHEYCSNPNPEINGRTVRPEWCCNLYDHPGMKVIV
jgi:hypothetical protein